MLGEGLDGKQDELERLACHRARSVDTQGQVEGGAGLWCVCISDTFEKDRHSCWGVFVDGVKTRSELKFDGVLHVIVLSVGDLQVSNCSRHRFVQNGCHALYVMLMFSLDRRFSYLFAVVCLFC